MKSLPFDSVRQFLMLAVVGATGILASCSTTDVLEVRQFHLNSTSPANKEAQMVRGEQMYRLRGAVTLEEREKRLGQYYTVSWKDESATADSLKIVMDYQQAATGSKVLRMTRELPSGQASGRVEFKVTGEAYRVGGRVLSWRIRMMRGSKIIAEKRSYLWR